MIASQNFLKVTGGRNGYGAKLANIFSTEFVIETSDGMRGRKCASSLLAFEFLMICITFARCLVIPDLSVICALRYKQVFSENMSTKTAPKIVPCNAGENWTCVSFKPDLSKFGMETLEDDTVSLMRKRVYDLAGVLGRSVKVCPFAKIQPSVHGNM